MHSDLTEPIPSKTDIETSRPSICERDRFSITTEFTRYSRGLQPASRGDGPILNGVRPAERVYHLGYSLLRARNS